MRFLRMQEDEEHRLRKRGKNSDEKTLHKFLTRNFSFCVGYYTNYFLSPLSLEFIFKTTHTQIRAIITAAILRNLYVPCNRYNRCNTIVTNVTYYSEHIGINSCNHLFTRICVIKYIYLCLKT